MGRKIKRCSKKCERHAFCLKPVHYSAVFSRELSASFCPTSGVNPSITPRFNNDKRHFTASFYLPVDNQKLSKNEEFYKNEHERYKMEHIAEKSNIFQARPKSKYSYCNVCKLNYDEYLEHIRSSDHKKKIRDNQFSFYIDQMCLEMRTEMSRNDQIQKQSLLIENEERINEILLTSFAHLTQKAQLNKESKLPLCSSFMQKITPLPSYKSFHAFSEFNEQKNITQVQEQEIGVNNPHSPLKRYSQVTEGARLVSNLRPIILHGSQHDLNF